MPIYKYTLKKYAKSYSTWIIMTITAIIIFFAAGFLPFRVFAPSNAEDYSRTALILIPTLMIFLSIFTSVFSGFKSANMFKDEIEDGTFLIIISKPISRSSILIYKWLSLQTFLLGYSVFTSASLAATLAVFDNGSQVLDLNTFLGLRTLRDNAFIIFGFVSIILYVMSLTFSSIAILLSTRLSVSTTVGISIALGVVIPITTLVRTFTQNKENKIAVAGTFFNKLDEIFNRLKGEEFIKNVEDDIKKINERYKISNDPREQQFHNLTKLIDFETNIKKYRKSLLSLASDPKNIYNIGININRKNSYKNLWFLDTYFQIGKLSSLVYDEIIPNSLQEELTTNYSRVTGYKHSIKDNIFDKTLSTQESLEKFDEFIEFSWSKTKEMRADFLSLWLTMMILNRKEIQENFEKAPDSTFKKQVNRAYWVFIKKFKPVEFSPLSGTTAKFDDNNFFQYVLKVITWIHESKKQQHEGKIEKIVSLLELFLVLSYEHDLRKTFRISRSDFSSLFYPLTAMAHKFLLPIESLKRYKIDEVITSKKLYDWRHTKYLKNTIKTKYNDKTKEEEIDFSKASRDGFNFTKVYTYILLTESVIPDYVYKSSHAKINRLIAKNIQFNRIETRDYASKYEILAIFCGIAIVLIPITYWSIRKKDFK